MAWPSLVNVLLGSWLSVSPWPLGWSNRPAASSSILFGLIVIMLAFASVAVPRYRGFAILNALAGLWVFASPWILGFADGHALMWNSVFVGGFVVLFSLARAAVPVPVGPDDLEPPPT